jgi:hypothetical protein
VLVLAPTRDAIIAKDFDERVAPVIENLQNIWILHFSSTWIPLAIVQIVDLALTLIHSLQERKGQLWRYFGAIAGVKIPDSFGQVVFFGGLTLSLWIVGLIGIYGTVTWQTPLTFGCLGAIVGSRLSDSLCSHVRLSYEGYKPNPGLESVPLYLVESVVLTAIFLPTVAAHPGAVTIGFTIGAFAFYSVIPTLRILGPLVFEKMEPWRRGTPQPQW